MKSFANFIGPFGVNSPFIRKVHVIIYPHIITKVPEIKPKCLIFAESRDNYTRGPCIRFWEKTEWYGKGKRYAFNFKIGRARNYMVLFSYTARNHYSKMCIRIRQIA